MDNQKIKILAVDDEEINLEILEDDLTLAGYEVICAEDGQIAWDLLQHHDDIEVILLDRMMPVMNGMELIGKLKADDRYKNIPVIMQTGAAVSEQVKEGIDAGVYYYLTKPYDEELLLAIVNSAIEDNKNTDAIKDEICNLNSNLTNLQSGLHCINSSTFEFSHPSQINTITFILANCCPEPGKVVLGITELMQNAIEHGNLGIDYQEKLELLVNGKFQDEIQHRLELPRYRDKKATVEINRKAGSFEITITDEGQGFNWDEFMQLSPERATAPNGRGIAMSGMMSFDQIEYIGCGNKVICTIKIEEGTTADSAESCYEVQAMTG